MQKMNRKKLEQIARARHLKWINYYGSKNFGMWVECTKCKKWRRTLQYRESHEVPEKWYCSMLKLESGQIGCCSDPEEESAELYLDYSPGTVVWAKIEGYPWWPAMVDADPDTDEYAMMERGILCYNVTFLDKKPTRAWVPERFICPFVEPPEDKKGYLENSRQNKYFKKISKAKERAEAALKMTINDRLQAYSFAYSYKGNWPIPPKSGECDEEENGNFKSKTSRLIKKTELGHSGSTITDDKRIKKDFRRKENGIAEAAKLFSNPDILSSGKNTSKKKNLNKKDIPDNGWLFASIKKKDSKHSSSLTKSFRINSVEYAETNTDPVQEKDSKGIKKKLNTKFKSSKEEKFDEPSQSLTGRIIDSGSANSEHKKDGNMNVGRVSKVDDKSAHGPKKRFIAKSNENRLSKISSNFGKQGAKKQAINVKSLMVKKLKKKANISGDKTFHSTYVSSEEEKGKHTDETSSTDSEFSGNETFERKHLAKKKKMAK